MKIDYKEGIKSVLGNAFKNVQDEIPDIINRLKTQLWILNIKVSPHGLTNHNRSMYSFMIKIGHEFTTTEKEKILSAMTYGPPNEGLKTDRIKRHNLCAEINSLKENDLKRKEILKKNVSKCRRKLRSDVSVQFQ